MMLDADDKPAAILVVIDGPAAAAPAVDAALSMCDVGRSRIMLLGLGPPPPPFAGAQPGLLLSHHILSEHLRADVLAEVKGWLRESLNLIPPRVAVQTAEVLARPARGIRRALRRDEFDLVIVCMDRRGWSRRRETRALERLAKRAPVPVICVPCEESNVEPPKGTIGRDASGVAPPRGPAVTFGPTLT
jgi:nucleotide-binding universal stress UspA family protein